MTKATGTCTGSVSSQSAVAVPDETLHAFVIGTVIGNHKSDDEAWNGAKMIYSGMLELRDGKGRETGYLRNEYRNGDTSLGRYEADVTISGMETTIKGTWTLTSGTGRFEGVKGGGTFEGRMPNPMTIHMKWSGDYELAR